ncbi:hypothetical protein E2C01_028856 [Portunus trituberculatus]|uniref:Uncharacterized protein n=1 Tax=Portunus trituberculatus TaxID=210409 RepID=A0A5B7ET03_PORTR|nr:hypothetical protein [Portunus trituberculatus]
MVRQPCLALSREAAVNQAPASYNHCKSALPFKGRRTLYGYSLAAVTPGTLNPDNGHLLSGLLTIHSPSQNKSKSSDRSLWAICVMYGGPFAIVLS